MKIREIKAKSVLGYSRIPSVTYCLNPYVGCAHACRYCYAAFIARRAGYTQRWGEYVNIKVNAPALLASRLPRARRGTILLSSVTDPYQFPEKQYRITRKCLEIIQAHAFPVSILTKDILVLRDLELIKKFGRDAEVGFSITTDNNETARIFEPYCPAIDDRISALGQLHKAGISTYAFIGPILPMDTSRLVEKLSDKVDYVLIDKMNYSGNVSGYYRRLNLQYALRADYHNRIGGRLESEFGKRGIKVWKCFAGGGTAAVAA